MNDWQLVAAYAQGDEQAFESLVRKYFPIVYSAAVRQVSDPHLAEEIAQSVFILFSRKAARLSPNVLLAGWFLRTTRFVTRDALKQMSRRLRREQQAAEVAAINQPWDPDWTSLAPLLDEALLALSDKEQECVLARFIEGCSFREIGELQRVTEDTAQKRVSRSVDKMRTFLERRGLRVTVNSITGLLSVDLARVAGPQLLEAALSTVQAAVQGQAVAAKSLSLADHVARSMAWRAAVKVGLSLAVGIILLTGGFVAWRQTRPASPAMFQVSDNRIDVLGRAWAVVVQRAAFMMSFPQRPPPAGDPNRAAYDAALQFVLSETARITTGLIPIVRESDQLAEFLTVELRETLGLDARQQMEIFARLRARLSQGPSSEAAIQALWQSKKQFANELRQRLSAEQKQRFDQTYGTDAIGFLAFLGLQLGKV